MSLQYIISTDLDGTLLNHDDYRWQSATEALNKLNQHNIPVIINTSKSRLEVKTLIEEIGLSKQSYVVENGSALILNQDFFNAIAKLQHLPELQKIDNQYVWVFGIQRSVLLEWLYDQRSKYQLDFEGYNDWDIQTIIEKTGLSENKAKQSYQKEFSEPFEWYDSEESLQQLTMRARLQGFDILKGGRFYHLQANVSKASVFDFFKNHHSILFPSSSEFKVIALGDNHNDVHMLNAADYSIVIKSPVNDYPELKKTHNLVCSEYYGAKGWNIEILKLLKTLDINT